MLPSGLIMIWSGAIVNIPAGYVLCDGNNGTPDLRNRFVVGSGDTYDPGDNGGSAIHNHLFTSDGHDHQIAGGLDLSSGAVNSLNTTVDTDTGTTGFGSTLPPYYSLAYIMKT